MDTLQVAFFEFCLEMSRLQKLLNLMLSIHMQTFGSQAWDASFAIQALDAANLTDEIGPTLMKIHDFIKKSQVLNIYI